MKRVGLKDVAAKAGVSVATASYVMAGRGRVSEDTRKAVLKAADTLGFVRNAAAANLRSGQSKLIGVILNNIANPFFSYLVSELESTGYDGFCEVEIFSADRWWKRPPDEVLDVILDRFQTAC